MALKISIFLLVLAKINAFFLKKQLKVLEFQSTLLYYMFVPNMNLDKTRTLACEAQRKLKIKGIV